MIETTTTMHESGTTVASRLAARTASGEGEAYWFFGGLVAIRSPEGARPVVIETTMAPGGAAPLHVHTTLDDNIYLLSGRLAVRSGDRTFVLRAGDYVSEPAGVPQALTMLDDQPAVLLQIHAGEDFLQFIRQAGTPATDRTRPPDGPLDFEALYRIAAATGQQVIGPPMTAEEVAAIVAAEP
jgi:quercetin dioxygenase-like cupin family protein